MSEANKKNSFIDPILLEPHYSARVFKGYFSLIKNRFGQERTNDLLLKTGIPIEYFSKDTNWVSEVFAERFYEVMTKDLGISPSDSYDALSRSVIDSARGPLIALISFLSLSRFYKMMIQLSKQFNRTDKINVKIFGLTNLVVEIESNRQTAFLEHIGEEWRGMLETVPLLWGMPKSTCTVNKISDRKIECSVSWTERSLNNRIFEIAVLLIGPIVSCADYLLHSHFGIKLPTNFIWMIYGFSVSFLVSRAIQGRSMIGAIKNHGSTSDIQNLLEENAQKSNIIYDKMEKLDRRYREAKLLNSVLQRLSQASDRDKLVQQTIFEIKETLRYDRVIFMELNKDNQLLSVKKAVGFSPDQEKEINKYYISLEEKTSSPLQLGTVVRNRSKILVPVTQDYSISLTKTGRDLLSVAQSKSFLITTVCDEAEVFGALLVDYQTTQKVLDQDDLHIVSNISTQLGICLSNLSRLHKERVLRESFQKFLDPRLVDSFVVNGRPSPPVSRNVTVLMADLRNFTSLSTVIPADSLMQIINDFCSDMSFVVYDHGGTVDKFVGDGILAIFNAFGNCPTHKTDALNAAIAMKKRIANLNNKYRFIFEKMGYSLNIGIGIHSGEVILGFLGSDLKKEFTAIGEAVNIASRLTDLSKKFDSGILASNFCIDQQNNTASLKIISVGKQKLRGLDRDLEIFLVEEKQNTKPLKIA